MWIFGSAYRDFLVLYFPGLLVAVILRLVPLEGPLLSALAFVCVVLISSGHTFTTFLRTYFDSNDIRQRQVYLNWFCGVLCLIFFWSYFQIPYLLSFVFYLNLFHHLRQYYGIIRWYERLNQREDPYSFFFSHALIFMPAVIYHFGPAPFTGNYTGKELFIYSNRNLFLYSLIVYSFLLIGWIFYEVRLWFVGIKELNRVLSLGGATALCIFCSLCSRDFREVLFPLLVSHGVAYYFIIGKSLNRISPQSFHTARRATYLVFAFGACFGILEFIFQRKWVHLSYLSSQTPVITGLILAIYLTPGVFHNLIDGRIWLGRHRMAKIIYRSS